MTRHEIYISMGLMALGALIIGMIVGMKVGG